MASEFRLYLDNQPASADQLEAVGQIRVEQAIGMAGEAELTVPLTLDDAGNWGFLEEDWVQPFRRIRVEVKVGEGDFVPLIDGPVVGQRVEMSAGPGVSELVLVVQDDSVLLDREEKVQLFEDMADSDIASQLIAEYGLAAEVDDTPAASGTTNRAVVQRGTNMHLLRQLAKRHGMFVYVKPGASPGASVGVFQRPKLDFGDLPEILLLGDQRNVGKFSAYYDALKPTTAKASSVAVADHTVQVSEASTSALAAMNGEPVHGVQRQTAVTLLSSTLDESSDIDAATQAAVDLSSWAYHAEVELDAVAYPSVLAPYDVVRVSGVGGYLSGDYLVRQVTHNITDSTYIQQAGLTRNSRSRGAGGGGLSIPGGLI